MKHLTWRQTAVFSFLFIVSLGFLVPYNIQFESAEEQIICRADTECLLNCGNSQLAGYCTQNLCSITSCESEGTDILPAQEVSIIVSQGDNEYNLADYIPNDIFVGTEGSSVLIAGDVPLTHVLERAGIQVYNGCLSSFYVNGCNLKISIDNEDTNINNHPNIYLSKNILIEVDDGYPTNN